MTSARPNIGINVAGTAAQPDPAVVAATAEQIVAVIEAGYNARLSDETIQVALRLLGDAAQSVPGVDGLVIRECTLYGGAPGEP